MNQPNRNKTNRARDANPTVAEIRAARRRVGLNQEEAARRIYSPSRAWHCWESDGEESRRMHPGLFELFLIKTGQTDLLWLDYANDGDGLDEAARFDECVAEFPETAAQGAQEVAGGLASGACEEHVCPMAPQVNDAGGLYVTRYGLRRIADCEVEPITVPVWHKGQRDWRIGESPLPD